MSYQQIQLSTLRARLQEKLDGTPFWSNAEALIALNEALRVWNAMAGFWKTRATATTTANVQWVTVPSTLTFSTRVEIASVPLHKVSLFEMDAAVPGWELQKTNTGGNVPTSIKFWMPAGLKKIAIWPLDAAGGTTLTFDGVAQTPVLVNDTDFIDIGSEELNTLIGYTLHILAFKSGGEYFAKTRPMLDAFRKAALTRNAMLGASEPFLKLLGHDFTRSADSMYSNGRNGSATT